MAYGFRWLMGDYVGGDTAVHQAYKPWLALEPEDWAMGEFTIGIRDTSDLVVSGLGFSPDVVILISYRPQRANNTDDRSFGARGGGMSYGVGGRGCPNLVQFSGTTKIRQGWNGKVSMWREDCCLTVITRDSAHATAEILRLVLDSLDPDGFTLTQPINLYDQTDRVAWLALKGRFKVGIMSVGDTELFDVPGTASGAMFLSTRLRSDQIDTHVTTGWDHMQGFATRLGNQAAVWGGVPTNSWEWSTERWADAHCILAARAATGSSFTGVQLHAEGRITDWIGDVHSVSSLTRSGSTVTATDVGHGYASGQCVDIQGATNDAYNGVQFITVTGVDTYTYEIDTSPASPASGTITATTGRVQLQYDTFNGTAYRVGYVLMGDPADSGVIETNWETRPVGSQVDFPDGSNWVPTAVRPMVVLMQATNYTFSYSNTDPFDRPRSPNTWQSGGGGGLGWHIQPFIRTGSGDAIGVHTYAGGVAERGHYANSGTQYMRNYIMAGQGANSTPPGYHQHSVNLIPNPRYVGLNYRYAERHAQVKRLHVNQSDVVADDL